MWPRSSIPEQGQTVQAQPTKYAKVDLMLNALTEQVLTVILTSVVSIIVGWLISSVRMTTRKEFAQQTVEINTRLDQIEAEQRTFITRTEFRDTMRDLKDGLDRQHDELREQLNLINATLLTRRGPTQDK